jgi:hypothetical protein
MDKKDIPVLFRPVPAVVAITAVAVQLAVYVITFFVFLN